MADPAAGAEDCQTCRGLQLQQLQSAQCRNRIRRHGAGRLEAQSLGDRGDIGGIHHDIFGVEAVPGAERLEAVHAVTRVKTLHIGTQLRDRARPFSAEHVGEMRLLSSHLGQPALAHPRIPGADPGRVDMDQHLIGLDLRDRQGVWPQLLRAAEPINRRRLHGLDTHVVSPRALACSKEGRPAVMHGSSSEP